MKVGSIGGGKVIESALCNYEGGGVSVEGTEKVQIKVFQGKITIYIPKINSSIA